MKEQLAAHFNNNFNVMTRHYEEALAERDRAIVTLTRARDTFYLTFRQQEKAKFAHVYEEHARYKDALEAICDPKRCEWKPAAMLEVAENALREPAKP